MMRKTKRGWAHKTLTHRDWAMIPANRFGLNLDFAEAVLKSLDATPINAFNKLANMGDDGALDYIFRVVIEP